MIECIPNFSEGRRQRVIDDVVAAAERAGCRILDLHSDPDHHRSVVTFVGDAETVIEGALALAGRAAALIDLRRHRGVHPRMGAVDVIPLVPLGRTSIDECVAAARRVACTIAERLRIPTFLYEEAATRGERRNLARVRLGGFEGLRDRIGQPGWHPDFGPPHLHPTAGATAVGARDFLVAFNVNLATDDLEIAQEIASSIRGARGGLPGVKALAVRLPSRGMVQVSMNLTDVRETSVARAFHWVRDGASRLGVTVSESEIVGLAPRIALEGASAEELLLTRELSGVTLEDRLASG